MKKVLLDNRQITIKEDTDNVGISFGSCQAIFTDDLVTKRAVVKFVSKLLNCLRVNFMAKNKAVIIP